MTFEKKGSRSCSPGSWLTCRVERVLQVIELANLLTNPNRSIHQVDLPSRSEFNNCKEHILYILKGFKFHIKK